MKTSSISFESNYKFLQNQIGLSCAYCGKLILQPRDVLTLHRTLEGKKGSAVGEILRPYLPLAGGEARGFLSTIINCSNEPKFSNWTFKQLSMLGKEPNIYDANSKITLANLLKSAMFSVEHTVPRSKNGINHYTNYLPMHISCNSNRSADSYASLIEENPNFIENLRKCLLDIKARILSDKAGKTHFKINLPEDYFKGIIDSISSQGLNRKAFEDILG